MFKAIFYLTSGAYNKAKTSFSGIPTRAFDELNLLVLDTTERTPGDLAQVINQIEFSNLESIPLNTVIIKTEVNSSADSMAPYQTALGYFKTNNIKVTKELFNFKMLVVELPKNMSYSTFSDKLSSETWVNYIEQDFLNTVIPCSAFSYAQHWHLGLMGAQEAWDAMSSYADNSEYNNELPEIAILDTGVQFDHPDLLGRVSGGYAQGNSAFAGPTSSATSSQPLNYNFDLVTPDRFPTATLSNANHGTPVAGIIAGNNFNNNYTLSVSNNYVRAQILQVLIGDNSASAGMWSPVITTSTSIFIQGLYYAMQNPRCVAVNISWTTSQSQFQTSTAAADALELVRTTGRNCKGIIIFASAGNSNQSTINFPANNPHVLAIGASDSSNSKASFSAYGSDLFLAAPGVNIRTIDRTGVNGYVWATASGAPVNSDAWNTELGTMLYSGTSASCAIVSGIAGCIAAINPNITAAEIETILRDTANPTGGYDYSDSGKSSELGYGVVRMSNAINNTIDQYLTPITLVAGVTINSSPSNVSTCLNQPSTIVTAIAGEIGLSVSTIRLQYIASADEYYTSTDFILATQYFNLNQSGLYTHAFTIPNLQQLYNTNYLIVRAEFFDVCGNIISDSSVEYLDVVPMTVQAGSCQFTDASVQILSSYISNGVRIYKIKYTNTGTTTITSINRTYGWVGGPTSTNTANFLGLTSATTPMLPGQSKMLYLSYPFNPPQYPATYFHRINAVNNGIDNDPTNNYATITITA